MSYRIDLTEQKAGTLIAKEYVGDSKWRCICDVCGNEILINTDWFRKLDRLGRSGCKHVKPVSVGDRYGYLTVISIAKDYIKPKSGAHERQWLCRCACGREKIILEDNLKSNKSMTCGMCSTQVSIPEKAILFYLKKVFDDVIENYRPEFLSGREIDIYVPTIKLGVEYDGERWHSDIDKDIWKNKQCELHGVKIIRIREPNCPTIPNAIVTPKPIMNGNHMTKPIKTLLRIIAKDCNIRVDIDVDCCRDNAEICKTLTNSMSGKSLAELSPNIAKEWDYDKNYPLTPNEIANRAGRKAWWRCPKGHSYSSVVASRTGKDACGCPICAGVGSSAYKNGKYMGEHSLAKERPDIAAEYMEEKNGVSSDNISVSSNKKMWFKCAKCGCEWQSKVNNRTSSNAQGCPVCGREKVRLSRCNPVLCVETGKIYESITNAYRQTGVNNISACCKGRIRVAGGYHWKFVK